MSSTWVSIEDVFGVFYLYTCIPTYKSLQISFTFFHRRKSEEAEYVALWVKLQRQTRMRTLFLAKYIACYCNIIYFTRYFYLWSRASYKYTDLRYYLKRRGHHSNDSWNGNSSNRSARRIQDGLHPVVSPPNSATWKKTTQDELQFDQTLPW